MKKTNKSKVSAKSDLQPYTAAMFDNVNSVLSSKNCGCPHCRLSFPSSSVSDWRVTDDGHKMTALCPYCGFTDVIPDSSGLPIDEESLRRVGSLLFPDEKSPLAAQMKANFLELYDRESLNESARNEALFLQYASFFAEQGNAYALTRIGLLYEFGTAFSPVDLKTAFSYYASTILHGDGFALARIGQCLEKGASGEPNYEEAYRCYAHSAALNNDYGKMYLGDCYRDGHGVKQDLEGAGSIYMGLFHSVLRMFISSHGSNPHILPELCLRISKLMSQIGDSKDKDFLSLRYSLIGLAALECKKKDPLFLHYELGAIEKELKSTVDELSGKLGAVSDSPYFDADTFFDTLDLFGENGYLEQGAGRAVFHEEEGKKGIVDMDLTMSCGYLFVVDVMTLYCGFEEGTTHWHFEEVEGFYPKKRKTFVFSNIEGVYRVSIGFQSPEGPEKDMSLEFSENGDDSIKDKIESKGQA